MCRQRMFNRVCGINNYNKPLIEMDSFDVFVDQDAVCFPWLWKHLCSLHGTQGNRSKANKKNATPRKRQVLLQLLVLRRMRNYQS